MELGVRMNKGLEAIDRIWGDPQGPGGKEES